jgi:hypothetical protein
MAQNRVIDQRGLECRGRKARGNAEKAEREHEADRTAAQQHCGGDGNDRQARRRPNRRLMLGGKIKDDAGAERDREPRQQPPGADLDRRPLADARGDRKLSLRPSGAPRGSRTTKRPRRRAHPRPACNFVVLLTDLRHHAPQRARKSPLC